MIARTNLLAVGAVTRPASVSLAAPLIIADELEADRAEILAVRVVVVSGTARHETIFWRG